MDSWKLATWNLDHKISSFKLSIEFRACDGETQQILNVHGWPSSITVLIENEKWFYERYQNFVKKFKIAFSHGSNEY